MAQESKGLRKIQVQTKTSETRPTKSATATESGTDDATAADNGSEQSHPQAPSLKPQRGYARYSISEALVEDYDMGEEQENQDDQEEVQFHFRRCLKMVLYHAFYPLSLPLIYFCEGPRYLGSVRQ